MIGEALIDLVPDGTGFAAHPGGSPYNVAIGLARLGVRTSLMARLGDNSFGRILRHRAEREGVDLRAAVAAPELTTLAVVSLDNEARASYDFYVEGTADWQWSQAETDQVPTGTTVFHFGSIASWTPPGDTLIAAAARRLRTAGTTVVSYDPNVRPLLLGQPDTARPRIEAGVALAHLVKASTDDIAWLYPDLAPDDVADRWLGLGPTVVTVTDGPHGARAHTTAGERLDRPGATVDVVDTVGAGDSFMAALLASLLARGVRSPEGLGALDPAQLAGALDDAIRASALTCQRAGADPPTVEQVPGFAGGPAR